MTRVNLLFDFKVTRRDSAINLLSDKLKIEVSYYGGKMITFPTICPIFIAGLG